MPMDIPTRLSWSSLSKYAECGERWKLEYAYGKTSSTWWATVAGSAIHYITEQLDLLVWGMDLKIPQFEVELDRFAQMEIDRGIEIKASGKVAGHTASCKDDCADDHLGWTGGPNKKDRDWWLYFGPQYIREWLTFREQSPWVLATMPDGKPGVEVPFQIELGGEPVRGSIDRVFIDPATGSVIVDDLKTGKEPAGKLQLGVYTMGLRKGYGLDPEWGVYWGCRLPRGARDKQIAWYTSQPFDLTVYSDEYVEYLFEAARAGINAGIFLPNVTSMCRGCGVRDFCRAEGGKDAITIPVRDEIKFFDPDERRRKAAEEKVNLPV